MKINAQLFLDHINKASVGGLINELVFGNHLSFSATEESKSVVSICFAGLGGEDTEEIGVFGTSLFKGAVQYAKDTLFPDSPDLEISVVERHSHKYMVFKNGDDEFTFLLSSPKLISTTVDNAPEVIEKVGEKAATVVVLTPAMISKCQKVIQLIGPAKCEIRVDSGKVKMIVGNELEHNAIVNLGTVKGSGKFKIVVKPDFLSGVLSVLPSDKETTLELRDALPLVFKVDNYVLLLASMEVK